MESDELIAPVTTPDPEPAPVEVEKPKRGGKPPRPPKPPAAVTLAAEPDPEPGPPPVPLKRFGCAIRGARDKALEAVTEIEALTAADAWDKYLVLMGINSVDLSHGSRLKKHVVEV